MQKTCKALVRRNLLCLVSHSQWPRDSMVLLKAASLTQPRAFLTRYHSWHLLIHSSCYLDLITKAWKISNAQISMSKMKRNISFL